MADVRMCGFERRTPVHAAVETLDARIRPLGSERVEVRRAAGRVASEAVVATVAVPHFPRSMMDGYAVVAESTHGASDYRPRALTVVGEVRAGSELERADALVAGEAVRITTGAPVPAGADAVVKVESTELQPATDSERERILVSEAVSAGKHMGVIGEDVAVGDTVIAAGRRLRPQDLGIAVSVGVSELLVVRAPSVRIVITGSELVSPGEMPSGARIVDSNSVVLASLVERDGGVVEETRYTGDDREALRAAMTEGDVEVVLVSGGSSVGPEDHAPLILAEVGEVLVHGVAMRPSSPAGFGFVGSRAAFLIPGNPVSCLCAYEFFAGRAIRALGGRPARWPHRRVMRKAAAKFVSPLGRTDYTRVSIDERGVHPLMTSGASILSSTTRADGVVIVPADSEGFAEGEQLEIFLYGDDLGGGEP
jgi:molybdopterin molybdotransferase